jgi:hypothetical protein
MSDWERAAKENGWTMPPSAWWQRLPVIRHARAIAGAYRVQRWYAAGPGLLGLRTGYDEWVHHGIWSGTPPHPIKDTTK